MSDPVFCRKEEQFRYVRCSVLNFLVYFVVGTRPGFLVLGFTVVEYEGKIRRILV
jgi:hypothetical protein